MYSIFENMALDFNFYSLYIYISFMGIAKIYSLYSKVFWYLLIYQVFLEVIYYSNP